MAGVSGEEGHPEKHEGFVAEERAHRLDKLEQLRKRGVDPYPPRYDRDHTAAEIRDKFGDLKPAAETKEDVRVAGRAMVAYAYMGGYALASADPVGAPGSIERAVDEFVAFCRDRGWPITFLAVREQTASMYVRRGFHTIYLGDEAIIPCDTFSLNGGGMKAVRAAVGRVGKEHHFRLIREPDAAVERRIAKALNPFFQIQSLRDFNLKFQPEWLPRA
jgi:Phosphatidylglycerol lysyltransferase, C-terminal